MKKLSVSILLLLSLVLLVGCANPRGETNQSNISSVQPAFSDKGRALTAPISLSENGFISAEDAKVTAFNHADINAQDAYKIEVELDIDDQVPHYDISFKAGNSKFEYEIHAQTAKILEGGREIEPGHTAKDEAVFSQSQAKSIALIHAGVQESDIRGLEIELDRENAKVVFEINFHSGAYEYEYEIDAESGTILKFERDR